MVFKHLLNVDLILCVVDSHSTKYSKANRAGISSANEIVYRPIPPSATAQGSSEYVTFCALQANSASLLLVHPFTILAL